MEHAASPGVAEGAVGFLQSIADVVESLGEFGSWQKVPAGLRRGCAVNVEHFVQKASSWSRSSKHKGVESF